MTGVGLIRRSRRRPDPFELVDVVSAPAPDPAVVLFDVVTEAVILQDEAEAVLVSVSRGEHLGLVAPRGGPLVHRFFSLRDRLPTPTDPRLSRLSADLGTILEHHALQVATSLEFLAVAGRSPVATQRLDSFRGLGRPAALLDEIYTELKAARRDSG